MDMETNTNPLESDKENTQKPSIIESNVDNKKLDETPKVEAPGKEKPLKKFWRKHKRLILIFVVGLILISIFLVVDIFLVNSFRNQLPVNQEKPKVNYPVSSPVSYPNPFLPEDDIQEPITGIDGKLNGFGYNLEYPQGWTAESLSSDYFGGEFFRISNEEGTVGLMIYPYYLNRDPYGFGGGGLNMYKGEELNIQFLGQKIQVDETRYNYLASDERVFVDWAQEGKYSFIFGTGYPASDDSKVSIDDYNRDLESILKILASFKSTGKNSLSQYTMTLPEGYKKVSETSNLIKYENMGYPLQVSNYFTVDTSNPSQCTASTPMTYEEIYITTNEYGYPDMQITYVDGRFAKSFYVTNCGSDSYTHVVQIYGPNIEFKMSVAGGGLEDAFQSMIDSVRFNP